jgi:hypothetical protein
MSENESGVPKPVGREGLIRAVIEKHDRFIAEYTSEFESLDGKVGELREKLSAARKSHEDAVQRIDVLREKRQQLYYQAKKTLEDIEPGVVEDRLLHSIHDDIEELKRMKEVDKEKELREAVLEKIRSIDTSAIGEHVSQLVERIKEAGGATVEMLSLENGQKNFAADRDTMADELKKDEPRHSWLDKRIASHREAREYWAKLETNNEAEAAE